MIKLETSCGIALESAFLAPEPLRVKNKIKLQKTAKTEFFENKFEINVNFQN